MGVCTLVWDVVVNWYIGRLLSFGYSCIQLRFDLYTAAFDLLTVAFLNDNYWGMRFF